MKISGGFSFDDIFRQLSICQIILNLPHLLALVESRGKTWEQALKSWYIIFFQVDLSFSISTNLIIYQSHYQPISISTNLNRSQIMVYHLLPGGFVILGHSQYQPISISTNLNINQSQSWYIIFFIFNPSQPQILIILFQADLPFPTLS